MPPIEIPTFLGSHITTHTTPPGEQNVHLGTHTHTHKTCLAIYTNGNTHTHTHAFECGGTPSALQPWLGRGAGAGRPQLGGPAPPPPRPLAPRNGFPGGAAGGGGSGSQFPTGTGSPQAQDDRLTFRPHPLSPHPHLPHFPNDWRHDGALRGTVLGQGLRGSSS